MLKRNDNFRNWKKGKNWVYASTAALTIVGAGAVVVNSSSVQNMLGTIATKAKALDLVNGTQIGTLNGAPVIKSATSNMTSPEFQALADSITTETNLDGLKYVADKIQWNGNSQVVWGSGVTGETVGADMLYKVAFKPDGYQDSDAAATLAPGQKFLVTNVGTVTNIETGEKIPVDLAVTHQAMTRSDLNNNTNVMYGVRNENGVITIAAGVHTDGGGVIDTGGGNEAGTGIGSGGGVITGKAQGWIQSFTYSATLVDARTGTPIPNEQLLLAMKVSDVDAGQDAVVDNASGAIAYILSPDTGLTQSATGFVGAAGAVNPDTTQLTSTSYVVLKRANSSTITYNYTFHSNQFDIVTALFGNTGFTPTLDKDGAITVRKTGAESNTSMWNGNYTLQGNKFRITNKKTGEVFEQTTDASGVVTFTKVPFGTYTVEEVSASNGFAKTFQTQEVTIDINTPKADVNGKQEQLVTVNGTNQEITGKTKLIKTDAETGKTAQGNATLTTAQYALHHADGTPVTWSEIPGAKVTKGTKVTSGVINGKTVNYGDNVVVDVDDTTLEAEVERLALGDYYWQEVNAPKGYVLDTTKHTFSITKQDDATTVVTAPDKTSKEQVIKAKISLLKLVAANDTASSGHNGISFKLTPINGTLGEVKTITTSIKGDEDGYANIELPFGDYMLTEVASPDGYETIKPVYIKMTYDEATDVYTITASSKKDGSNPFSKRTFVAGDGKTGVNGTDGVINEASPFISLSRLNLTNNTETPDPNFEPHKFDLSKTKADIKGEELLDDDNELNDRYADTAADPYVDKKDNNEDYNLNTDTVVRTQAINYQLWLDTNQYVIAGNKDKNPYNVTAVGMVDDFDERYFLPDGASRVKVYDGETGADVTKYFDIKIENGKLYVDSKVTTTKTLNDGKEVKTIDTDKLPLGRYYKIELTGIVSSDTPSNTDIVNVASQYVNRYKGIVKNGEEVYEVDKSSKPTETRVNKVVDKDFNPHKFDLANAGFDLTGESLLDDDSELTDRYADTKANPYSDQTDNNEEGNINATDVAVNSKLTYQLWLDTLQYTDKDNVIELGMEDDFDEKYFIPNGTKDVKIYDGTTGQNVNKYFDVTIKDGVLKVVANASAMKEIEIQGKKVKVIDTEKLPLGRYYKIDFSGKVAPTTPAGTDIVNTGKQILTTHSSNGNGKKVEKPTETRVNKVKEKDFTPHKYDLNRAKFDITGDSLLDDDNESDDPVATTAADPYSDDSKNNEEANINTFNVSRGDTLNYQLWADTTQYSEADNLNKFGMTDKFDTKYLDVDAKKVKVYDGEAGADVTKYFDITVENGVLTVQTNDKATKTIKVNGREVKVIDTKKVALGRYYKIDFPTIVKADTPSDTDIVNVAAQFIDFIDPAYTPNPNKPEDPDNPGIIREEKPTETRVNKVVDKGFTPHKFDLSAQKYDITGDKLLANDSEMTDPVNDSAQNPYNDKTDNNDEANINTQVVSRGQVLTYQLWADVIQYDAEDNLMDFSIEDDFDETKVTPQDVSTIKVYDGKTGEDVTAKFDITIENGKLTVKPKDEVKKDYINSKGETVRVIDTEKLPLGRYYKIDFLVSVKADVPAGTDIVNVASQTIIDKNGKQQSKATETRVNKVKEDPKPNNPLPKAGDPAVWGTGLFAVTGLGALLYYFKRRKDNKNSDEA